MRITEGSVGPRAVTLLVITAVAGGVLALHGWSARHSGLTPGALAGASPGSSAPASPVPSAGSSRSAGPGSTPGSAAPAASPGPLLSSQSFASYSYQVWPGTPSAAAQTAMTGLSISVRRQHSGISVAAGVNGQPPAAPQVYPAGTRVYVVEATLGDDSGNSDYNLGDDGLVVTDAKGRIVQ